MHGSRTVSKAPHVPMEPGRIHVLSHMLGVRRTTVSVEAHALQQAGLIRYARGHIKILNRDGLEDCACECYSVIRAETDKMMGLAKPGRSAGRVAEGRSSRTMSRPGRRPRR